MQAVLLTLLLTLLALCTAFGGSLEASAYTNASFDGELTLDCVLAGGRSSCVNPEKVLEECAADRVNTIYTVHFLLGPMHGVDTLLNETLPPPLGDGAVGAKWYVQNRSLWGDSLLELARGRNSYYDGLVLDPAIVPEMVASGALMDLEPFLVTDRWRGHWPGILSALRWQVAATRNVMIPLGAAATVLHYRADVLAAHGLGVPRTWEQMLQVARVTHGRPAGPQAPADEGFYGFCTMPFAGCHADAYELTALWASFIQTTGQAQGAYFDPETFTPLVKNAGMRAALLYYRLLGEFAPPHTLAATHNCSSMYGTAESLYSAGACALQLAPHPAHKRNALLAPSEEVRLHSRVTWLPGATAVLDRPTGRLVSCSQAICPFAQTVQEWPGDAELRQAVLAGVSATQLPPPPTAAAAAPANAVLANVAPVLALSPLALGINNFTSLRQKAHSLEWLRRVTDPKTVWRLVVSPATPLAPFRYEHFSPSNLRLWTDAGYAVDEVREYLALSYGVLTHGNLLSYPWALQRMLQYRTTLHVAAYNMSTTGATVESTMDTMAAALAVAFGHDTFGFGTLRLQYLVSIGRADLLAAPAPPPPPPPPEVRYLVGREARPRSAAAPDAGAAVGAAVGATAAAGLAALAAFLYKRLMVERGWGRSKDPGVGRETTLVVTDIEASTVLWEDLDSLVMDVALNLHHETVRRVIAHCHGYESVTEGDSFTVAFHTAEAAVGFSLHVQSELMEQPWPPEVLTHEAGRAVYVVGAKRLRHLAAKASAAATAAATAGRHALLDAATSFGVEQQQSAGSGSVLASLGQGLGQGQQLRGARAAGAGDGLPPLPLRTFSRMARRIDMLSGLSMQVRRSMSFINRAGSGSNPTLPASRGGSLLTAALAGGGGSGSAAAAGGGGGGVGGFAARGAPSPLLSRVVPVRTTTGDSVLLDAAGGPPCEASTLTSTRNLLDHFLPYSAAAAPPPRVAAAAAAGSMSVSLSLGQLPVGIAAANTSAAAAASGGGAWGRSPSLGCRPGQPALYHCESAERNDSGGFAVMPEAEPSAADIVAAAAAAVGGVGGFASGPAGGVGGHGEQPQQRMSGLLAAALAATSGLSVAAPITPGAVRSGQSSRTIPYGLVAPVPEEPAAAPPPPSPLPHGPRMVVRRTHSTVVVAAVGGGAASAGVDGASTSAAWRGTSSGSGMLGPSASLRSPFRSFEISTAAGSAFRRPSRLADPPPLVSAEDCREDPTFDRLSGGDAVAGPSLVSYMYGTQADTTAHRQSGTAAAALDGVASPGPLPASVMDSAAAAAAAAAGGPSAVLQELRERQLLDDEAGGGGPTGRSLRGWRSWTGTSIGILRRMQRSFRHVTVAAVAAAAAGASKLSFSRPRSGDAAAAAPGSGGGRGGVAAAATADALDLVSRDALVAAAAGWEVESRSSSQSHGTQHSSGMSHASNIQSALLLQPGRHANRRGGGGAVGGGAPGGGGKTLFASPSTYGSELRSTWTELPTNLGVDPASVGAVLVYRGFRVRCGMHSGVRSPAEVDRQHRSGRTRYSGPALLCAKAVSDAAHGGMVVASRASVALCPAAFLASRVVVWRLGDAVLGGPRLPASLYQLSNTALVLRAALQRPLTRTFMPLGLGLLDAPLSVVACAAIRLASPGLLEQASPAVSLEVASVFQALSYQYARLHGGYLAQLGVGRALAVFADAYRAALWSALVGAGMAGYPWSGELLAMEGCGPRMGVVGAKGNEVEVSRGPRIQAVVHFGPVSTLLNPLTGQLSYEGGAVDATMRVLNSLSTTGVVATMEAAASLRRYRPAEAARAAVAVVTGGSGGANASNTSGGVLASSQLRASSSRRRTDAEGGGGGDVTGSNSQRSSAATWRDSARPHPVLMPPPHHHPQEGVLPRSRSSADHTSGLAGQLQQRGETAGSSSGGGGGGGGASQHHHARQLARVMSPRAGTGPPSGSYNAGMSSRVVGPRRASGPILMQAVASGGAAAPVATTAAAINRTSASPDGLTAAAAAASSPLWRRPDDGGRGGGGGAAKGRSPVPRAASAVIPGGTDSANTSGTDGTDNGTGGAGGGAGGSSRRDSQADSGVTAGGLASTPRRVGSGQQLSINLSTGTPSRGGGGGGGVGPAGTPSTGGGGAAGGGDAAARAAALAAAGLGNDSLLLLLTMSCELPPTATTAGGGQAGGGGRRDVLTVSGSGGNPMVSWMISGGVPQGGGGGAAAATAAGNSAAANARRGPSASHLDTSLASGSYLRPDGSSTGGGGGGASSASKDPPQTQEGGAGGMPAVSAAATTASAAEGAQGAAAAASGPQPTRQQDQRQQPGEAGVEAPGGTVGATAATARHGLKTSSATAATRLPRPARPPVVRPTTSTSSTSEGASAAAATAGGLVSSGSSGIRTSASAPPPRGPDAIAAAGASGAAGFPPSVPSNDASDCRPQPGGGAAASSHSASSADTGTVSPASPLSSLRRGGSARAAAAAAAATTVVAAATAAAAAAAGAAGPAASKARQSIDSAAISSTQPSSAEASSDPDAAAPSAAMPPPQPSAKRAPPLWHPRQLRQQYSARDSTAGNALGPERIAQSFTFGQKGTAMMRPRLQDLLSVSPYTSTANPRAVNGSGGGDNQPTGGATGSGGAGGSRLGGGSSARRGQSVVERTPAALGPDPSCRSWGSELPSPPSSRTGYGVGQGSASLEALIRGPNGRMSRSFTFTTHRRSPLAVSSYAGDPEIGAAAVNSNASGGAGGGGGGSMMRPMSSLSRVFYNAGAAVGLMGRDASAAAAGGGYDASRETTPRGSSQGPQGAATAAAAAAAAAGIGGGGGGGSMTRSGRRDAAAAAAVAAAAAAAGATPVNRSLSWSRSMRARRGSLPHPQLAVPPAAAAGALVSGPCGGSGGGGAATATAQPWGSSTVTAAAGAAAGAAAAAAAAVAASLTPFTLPYGEYCHSSNSAGTLPMSLNSTQMRTSTLGESRGSAPEGRGSGGTSAATASPPNGADAASSASAAMASGATSTAVTASGAAAAAAAAPSSLLGSGGAGHLSGILARMRGSMKPKSRSKTKSLARAFVTAVAPLEVTSPAGGGSPQGGGGGSSGPGSIRHEPAAPLSSDMPCPSGASARLATISQYPSGSSAGAGGAASAGGGAGAGAGGGGVAGVSRTLRGLLLTEKLPTLPEAGLAPLLREVQHLRLRLVPLRLVTRGGGSGDGAVKGAAATAAQEAAELAARAPHVTVRQRSRKDHHHHQHQRRDSDYMQVYRVLLRTPEPAAHPHPHLQLQQASSSRRVGQLSLPQASSFSQLQLPPSPSEPQPQPRQSCSEIEDRGPVTESPAGEAAASGDGDASRSVPLLPGGGSAAVASGPAADGAAAAGEVDEMDAIALVAQFLSGFADLSDPQLAELWAAHPERSLLQDRRLADVVQLRARLAAQAAHDEVFDRDNFLF